MTHEHLTLFATGDICLERKSRKGSKEAGTPFFGNTTDLLRSGDMVFGNLECPLSNNGKPIFKAAPKLRAAPDVAPSLKAAGFTVLNLANNHINDFGGSAIMDTIGVLQDLGIEFVGAGSNIHEANAPKILEVDGRRIAVLGYCDKEESIATGSTPGAAQINEKLINRQIDQLKNDGQVGFIVLSLHMGIEFVDFPSPHNIEMCRRFIRRGVHVILGHHPHVPQGYEIYEGGLIIYSMGNFVFDMGELTPDKAKMGYIYQIILSDGGVQKVTPIPYKMGCNYAPYLVEKVDEKKTLFDYLERLSNPLNDQDRMEEIWYSASRFFTRQLIKGLLKRTFRQKKWWYPMWWLKTVFRPQIRRVWTSYLSFVLKGTHKKTSTSLAFMEFKLSNETKKHR